MTRLTQEQRERVDAARQRHRKSNVYAWCDECDECGQDWPCDTRELVEIIEQMESAVRTYADMLDVSQEA